MARSSSPAGDIPWIVLAGGLGTRMRPSTDRLPKMLLPVAGEPFAAHQLRALAREGARDVVIATGHLGELIESFVGDGHAFGVHVSYSADGPLLLGTGGAVRQAVARRRLVGPVGVVYGDSYLSVNLDAVVERFAESGAPALTVVFRNAGALDTSNADFDGRLVRYDKRCADPQMHGLTFIDYGASVFDSTTLLERIPPNEAYDLSEVQAALSSEGRLAGYEAVERFYEIGSPQGLADLERHLALRD